MTHSDRFRALTDEEMAECLAKLHCPPGFNCKDGRVLCYDCWLNYLKQEIPVQLQKVTLCLSCVHGDNGAIDGLVTCYCPFHGFVVQKAECAEYVAKET